jgi:hypothetical protein
VHRPSPDSDPSALFSHCPHFWKLVLYQAFARLEITGSQYPDGSCATAPLSRKPNWNWPEEKTQCIYATSLHASQDGPHLCLLIASLAFQCTACASRTRTISAAIALSKLDSPFLATQGKPAQRSTGRPSSRSANPACAQIAKHSLTSHNPRRNSHPRQQSAPHLPFQRAAGDLVRFEEITTWSSWAASITLTGHS